MPSYAQLETKPKCAADDCGRPQYGHGLCNMHYQRKRDGYPKKRPTASDRFWAKVDKSDPDGCWSWLGSSNENGYGSFRVGSGKGKLVKAHRFAVELGGVVIPEGMVVDHQCHNADTACMGGASCRHRRCVNPAHLEVTTQQANLLAGRGPVASRSRSAPTSGDDDVRV